MAALDKDDKTSRSVVDELEALLLVAFRFPWGDFNSDASVNIAVWEDSRKRDKSAPVEKIWSKLVHKL